MYIENTGSGRGLLVETTTDTAVWAISSLGLAAVDGRAASSTGRGVYGYATATTGANSGVYGWAEATSGVNYGVYRRTSSASGYGDFVAIVYSGLAQARLAPGAGDVAAGKRLTVAGDGRVRPLGSIAVQLAGDAGTAALAENAPVVGLALDAARSGLVWVLVNPQ